MHSQLERKPPPLLHLSLYYLNTILTQVNVVELSLAELEQYIFSLHNNDRARALLQPVNTPEKLRVVLLKLATWRTVFSKPHVLEHVSKLIEKYVADDEKFVTERIDLSVSRVLFVDILRWCMHLNMPEAAASVRVSGNLDVKTAAELAKNVSDVTMEAVVRGNQLGNYRFLYALLGRSSAYRISRLNNRSVAHNLQVLMWTSTDDTVQGYGDRLFNLLLSSAVLEAVFSSIAEPIRVYRSFITPAILNELDLTEQQIDRVLGKRSRETAGT